MGCCDIVSCFCKQLIGLAHYLNRGEGYSEIDIYAFSVNSQLIYENESLYM